MSNNFTCNHYKNIESQANEILCIKNDIEFFINKIIKEKSDNQTNTNLPEWR